MARPKSQERWDRAKSLAAEGKCVTEASRILGINHSTALYISRKMGFTWPKGRIGSVTTLDRSRVKESESRLERMLQLSFRANRRVA